jgi:Icc-related predicted phosphoesterase
MDSAEIDDCLVHLGISLNGRGVVIGDVGFFGVSAAPLSPLHTPYELDDDELGRRAREGAAAVAAARLRVFCPHAPPYGTACDRLANGEHAGSRAIRAFVEDEQPEVVLCGHIHEARGRDEIGRSRVVNPGPGVAGHFALLEIGEEVLVVLDGEQPLVE